MPRILKRPMFSRGGTTKKNNGIMTGLVDRTELSVGSSPFTAERTSADVKAMMDAMNEYAPVTKQRLNLGKVGLNLASGKYSGGDLISTLAGAGSDIYDDYTTKDDAYRAALAKRKQAAVSSSLAQQLKEANVKPKDTRTKEMIMLEEIYGKDSPQYKAALEKLVLNPLEPKDERTNLMKEVEAVYGKDSPEYKAALEKLVLNPLDPKDTRTAVIKNADVLDELGFFKSPEDKAKYIQAATIKGAGLNIEFDETGKIKSISEGDQGDTKTKNAARDLKINTFKMNNAANNLFKNLEGAKTGPVGAFVQALDSTGSQLKQVADSFGFKSTGPKELRTFDDTGSGAIDNYIEKNFGSFIGNDAVQLGKIKSASINLAYLMARIDEPGGRFTDRDIALKMEELGLGANPERTIAVMKNAIKLRNDNAAFEYRELTKGEELDFSKMNVFGKEEKKQYFRPGPDGIYRFYETEKD